MLCEGFPVRCGQRIAPELCRVFDRRLEMSKRESDSGNNLVVAARKLCRQRPEAAPVAPPSSGTRRSGFVDLPPDRAFPWPSAHDARTEASPRSEGSGPDRLVAQLRFFARKLQSAGPIQSDHGEPVPISHCERRIRESRAGPVEKVRSGLNGCCPRSASSSTCSGRRPSACRGADGVRLLAGRLDSA